MSKNIVGYQIVSDSNKMKFDDRITYLLKQGYSLYKNVSVLDNEDTFLYTHELVKYENNDQYIKMTNYYLVVLSSESSFNEKTESLINNGWTLYGKLIIFKDGSDFWYIHAFVKCEDTN